MESAPAVMGNVVYFGSDRYLYAVDAANGNELWRVELADRVSSDVVVTSNGAYIGDQAGTLYAID
jgi:outer membrane protein assembly factor BamB